MSATIQIHELTADANTGVDKTSSTIRFKSVDSNASTAVDSSDPIAVPLAGSEYSYAKKVRAYMSAAPDVNISDLRWYTDGAEGYGTGISVNAKNTGTTFAAHYDTAMSAGSDLFGYTSGSPLDGDGTDTGPFVPGDNTTYIGDIIEMQMAVETTATGGQKTAESLTLAYSEI